MPREWLSFANLGSHSRGKKHGYDNFYKGVGPMGQYF